MAAPTNVRVESNSTTQAQLNWTYGGTNTIAVYRALHGGSYTELTSTALNTRVASGTTVYYDNTAVAGTFYDYKLSDDNGSTFSSVVSVVIQICVPPTASTQNTTGPALPQFTGQADITAQNLQNLSQLVEAGLSEAQAPEGFCTVCASNGAVVLDCTDGCKNFFVVASTDINSISVVGCGQSGGTTFVIPANTNGRKITGFPAGSTLAQSGLTGTQGFSTDSQPKQVSVSHNCKCDSRVYGNAYIVYTVSGTPCVCDDRGEGSEDLPSQSASPVGGGCTPNNGLTLVASNPDGTSNPTNSMNCAAANKGLNLQACGGQGPYSFSSTGDINFVGSSIGRATVLPATNNGGSVAGDAYLKMIRTCVPSLASVVVYYEIHDCSDAITATFQNDGTTGPFNCPDAAHQITCASLPVCKGTDAEPGNCNCGAGNFPGTTGVSPDTYCDTSIGSVCDKRTGTMISNGCKPCGVSSNGATVTVTDALGTQVTIVLRS